MKTSQEESELERRPNASAAQNSGALSSQSAHEDSGVAGSGGIASRGELERKSDSKVSKLSKLSKLSKVSKVSKVLVRPIGTIVKPKRVSNSTRPRRARCQQLEAEPRR